MQNWLTSCIRFLISWFVRLSTVTENLILLSFCMGGSRLMHISPILVHVKLSPHVNSVSYHFLKGAFTALRKCLPIHCTLFDLTPSVPYDGCNMHNLTSRNL